MNDEIIEILRKSDIDALSFGVVVNYITNLQQENERLKEAYYNKQDEYNKLFNHLIIDKPRERIKKAIEYIENIQEHRQGLTVIEYHKKWLEMYDYYESASIMGDLLNILQNGSDDNES